MKELFLYVIAFVIGLGIQIKNKWYIVNFIGVLLAVILPCLLSNNIFLDFIAQKAQLSQLNVIVIALLYSLGTSITFVIFKLPKIKKMERHIQYADIFVFENIDEILRNIQADFKTNPKLYSNEVYVALYLVKRCFWNKVVTKICRVSHVGMPAVLSEKWNGVLKKWQYSSIGQTVKDNNGNIVHYKEIKLDSKEFKGVPQHVLKWLTIHATFNINFPYKWEGKIIFVASVTSTDANFDWNRLTEEEKVLQLNEAKTILNKYEPLIKGLYDFSNCTL